MHCMQTFSSCRIIEKSLEFKAILRSLYTCLLVKYTLLENYRCRFLRQCLTCRLHCLSTFSICLTIKQVLELKAFLSILRHRNVTKAVRDQDVFILNGSKIDDKPITYPEINSSIFPFDVRYHVNELMQEEADDAHGETN